jgi:hypothetical protein
VPIQAIEFAKKGVLGHETQASGIELIGGVRLNLNAKGLKSEKDGGDFKQLTKHQYSLKEF